MPCFTLQNGTRHAFAEPNPFASEGEETASAAYRYSKWKLDEVSLVLVQGFGLHADVLHDQFTSTK